MPLKEIKLSVFGEVADTWPKSVRILVNLLFVVSMIVLVGLITLLHAWVINWFLPFVDWSFWEWYRAIIVFQWFTLAPALERIRIKQGVISVLRRV